MTKKKQQHARSGFNAPLEFVCFDLLVARERRQHRANVTHALIHIIGLLVGDEFGDGEPGHAPL